MPRLHETNPIEIQSTLPVVNGIFEALCVLLGIRREKEALKRSLKSREQRPENGVKKNVESREQAKQSKGRGN